MVFQPINHPIRWVIWLFACRLFPSRGTTIITQKENKGEYNGSWTWNNSSYDYNIYAHALDQTNSSGIPYRYASAGSIGTCPSTDIEDSATLLGRAKELYGNNQKISNQASCKPHVYNAGNWYNYPAATAGSDTHLATSSNNITAPNSICPKGWQLPPNSGNKSYNTLIRTAYGITATGSDSAIRSDPLSFVRLGHYVYSSGSLDSRGGTGFYWSSTASSSVNSRDLRFDSGDLNPQYGHNRAYGFSIRCVSR